MEETTEQVKTEEKRVPNPTGKGGFQDHPELINAGGRPKNQESFTYWLNYFKNLPVSEFLNWLKENPEDKRTVASELAYNRVFNARTDLPEFKEVADRTEGRAIQPLKHSGGIEHSFTKIEEIVDKLLDEPYTENQDFS